METLIGRLMNTQEIFWWLCVILTYIPKNIFIKYFKISKDTPKGIFYKKLIYSILVKMGLYYLGGVFLFYLNGKLWPYFWMVVISTIAFYILVTKNYIPNKTLSTSGKYHWKYGIWVDLSIIIFCLLQFIFSEKPIWLVGVIIWLVYFFTGGIQTSLMEKFERLFEDLAWTYSYAFVCTLIFLTAFLFLLPLGINLTGDKLIKFYASGIPLFVTIMTIHINSLLRVIDRHKDKLGSGSLTPLKPMQAFILYDSVTILIMLIGFLTVPQEYKQKIDINFLLSPCKLQMQLPFFIFSSVLCFVIGAIGTIYTSTVVYLRYIYMNESLRSQN